METILISLFIATILPIVAKAPLAYAMIKAGGYNNRYPRTQQEGLEGFGARCKAAHENSFEALIMYTPAALAVIALGVATEWAQYCAMAFVFARVMYLIMYWIDQHLARSFFWAIGFGASLLMFWDAMVQVAAVY